MTQSKLGELIEAWRTDRSLANRDWTAGRQWRTVLPVAGELITVAETQLFVRQAAKVWDDAEREAFVSFIAAHPEIGDIVPETGGVRKVRWSRPGRGKRGGARVIYYYCDLRRPLYLLMVYAKARQEDLSPDEKREIRKLTAFLKGRR